MSGLFQTRKRIEIIWLATCLFALGPLSPPLLAELADGEFEKPRIYWSNGDILEGNPVGASEGVLTWKSDRFAEPIPLRFDALHMVRFPVPPRSIDDVEPNSQIIETIDGNRFYGNVTGSEDKYLSIDTDLFGPIQMNRKAVSLIANPVERAHVYSGPKGLRGWRTLTYGRRLAEWDVVAGGQLRTNLVAAELYRDLPAKGSVDIEIELLWRSNPSFQIRFLTPYAKPTKETVKIETRVGGYVVQSLGSNGRFRQLHTIPNRLTKCRMMLHWNHASHELSIFLDRQFLGKIPVEKQTGTGPAGIYIKNTGPQLTLSRLEVRASSSLAIGSANPERDTVLLVDNKSIAGAVGDITADSISIKTEEGNETLNWKQVAEIAFREDSEVATDFDSDTDTAECVFQNGETLKGTVLGADNEAIKLGVPAIREPIRCRYDRLERLVIGNKTLPPKTGTPAMIFRAEPPATDIRLHGTLASGKANELAWLPTGATQPVRPAPEANVRIEVAGIDSTVAGGPQDDLLYFRDGDVVPGRLHKAIPETIDIATPFTRRIEIQPRSVSAVELASEPVVPLTGFDKRWRMVSDEDEINNNEVGAPDAQGEKTYNVEPDELRLTAPTTVQRESILVGSDRISFRTRRNSGKGGLFMHLGLIGDSEVRPKKLPFYFMDQKMFVLGSKRNAFIPSLSDSPDFHVVIETRDPFRVTVNEKTVYTIDGNENGGPWSGLSFEVSDGPLFGAAVKRKSEPIDLSIHDLHISQTRRQSIRQSTGNVDPQTLLTIPRNRQQESLTHLAIGSNSDAVRGNLLSLDGEEVRIQSKSEELRFPRNSISGLVWLHNEPTVERKAKPWRVVLKDSTVISLHSATLQDGAIIGQHPDLGECTIPASSVHAIDRSKTGDQIARHPFQSWQMSHAAEPKFDSQSDGHRHASDLIGKPLTFDAKMLDDDSPLRLTRYRGKIVVLDFWATWCAPCIRNMPKLISTIEQFSPEQVELIAVSQGEDPRTVASVVRAKEWNLTVATDIESSASSELGIEAIPQTVVLDQDGEVSAVFIGAGPRVHAEIAEEIGKLMGETP